MAKNNQTTFFGLNTSQKAKIIRKAADMAIKEQLEVVNKNGGIKALKSYSRA